MKSLFLLAAAAAIILAFEFEKRGVAAQQQQQQTCAVDLTDKERAAAFPLYYNGQKCYPCSLQCAAGQYLHGVEDACTAYSTSNACRNCANCGSDGQAIWDCLSGMRSSDSVRCISPASSFMDVRQHLCRQQGQYLTYKPSIGRYWSASAGLVSVNPTSTFFALSQKTE